jgi:GTP pyrophosphokinase
VVPDALQAAEAEKTSRLWSFPWFRKPKEKEPEKKSDYVIASCCSPIPGDAVIGIKSPDGVITVHKKTCPVADSIASKHGDWVVVPKWEDSNDQSFPARIQVKGLDRVGLLNEISRYISLVMGVNMTKLYLSTEEGIFEGYIELNVHDKAALDRMIKKLNSIDGIQSVVRSDI